MSIYDPEEECVQCTRTARGIYMGYPCCMSFDCMKEIKDTDDMSEKVAQELFGKWLKKMFKVSTKRQRGER